VTHEAVAVLLALSRHHTSPPAELDLCNSYLVMRSSMLLGSRMKVGKTTLLRSAPGLSWDMMCDRTLPWSGSTTRVSSSRPSPCDDWLEVRLRLLAFEVALRRPGTRPIMMVEPEWES